MKPFNLEAAKAGAKLVARDGTEVIHFHHVETDKSALPCVVQYADSEGASWIQANGCICSPDEPRDRDLFMAPFTRTVYVNIYGTRPDQSTACNDAAAFETEQRARANAVNNRAGLVAVAVPVTITE